METSKGLELYLEHGIVHLIDSGIEGIRLENNFRLFPIWVSTTASRVEMHVCRLKITSGSVGMCYFKGLALGLHLEKQSRFFFTERAWSVLARREFS